MPADVARTPPRISTRAGVRSAGRVHASAATRRARPAGGGPRPRHPSALRRGPVAGVHRWARRGPGSRPGSPGRSTRPAPDRGGRRDRRGPGAVDETGAGAGAVTAGVVAAGVVAAGVVAAGTSMPAGGHGCASEGGATATSGGRAGRGSEVGRPLPDLDALLAARAQDDLADTAHARAARLTSYPPAASTTRIHASDTSTPPRWPAAVPTPPGGAGTDPRHRRRRRGRDRPLGAARPGPPRGPRRPRRRRRAGYRQRRRRPAAGRHRARPAGSRSALAPQFGDGSQPGVRVGLLDRD